MKMRTAFVSVGVFLAGVVLCLAADANPNMGTWKLNEGKSKFSAGATKNTSVVYAAAAGDMVKVTVDGADKDGKAVHNEWTGKFDGKDYPVTGDPAIDARSYSPAGANTLNMTLKKTGKVVGTGTIVVSADGKTRTVTTTGADPKVTALNNAAVYDKQ